MRLAVGQGDGELAVAGVGLAAVGGEQVVGDEQVAGSPVQAAQGAVVGVEDGLDSMIRASSGAKSAATAVGRLSAR